jgi:hypothetical protein
VDEDGRRCWDWDRPKPPEGGSSCGDRNAEGGLCFIASDRARDMVSSSAAEDVGLVLMSEGARDDLRREGVGRPDPIDGRPGPGIPDRRGALGVECDMLRARTTSAYEVQSGVRSGGVVDH